MNKIFFVFLSIVISLSHGCAQKNDYVVTITTRYGDMVAILYDETPRHKANFIKLAKDHYFDSLLFHRAISGFMIQGGDPNSKRAKAGESLGNGGPGYTVDAEFNPLFFHHKGALCAARLGDQQNPTKASSGSQFYIVQGTVTPDSAVNMLKIDQPKMAKALSMFMQDPANSELLNTLNETYLTGNMELYKKKLVDLVPLIEKQTGMKITKEISLEKLNAYTTIGGAPHLDGEYTVFGKIVKGIEVIDKIAAVSKDKADRPMEDIRMNVTVTEMSRKKISKEYGNVYPVLKK